MRVNRSSFFRVAGIASGALVFIASIGSSNGAVWAQATPSPEKPSLVEASNAAKKKREQSSKSQSHTIVITNETLKSDETPESRPTATHATEQPTPAAVEDPEHAKMEMWRQRYRENRRLIESINDAIQELDAYIPELWREFYAMEDGNQRDKVMKPILDTTLAKRREREEQLKRENQNAAHLMRDARLDGALPGWFRNIQ